MSPGIFPVSSDSFMCHGVDSASKNEHQDNPGGKGDQCVRLTTYHLHVPIVKKSEGLNLLEPCGPVQACNGTALFLPNIGGMILTWDNGNTGWKPLSLPSQILHGLVLVEFGNSR